MVKILLAPKSFAPASVYSERVLGLPFPAGKGKIEFKTPQIINITKIT